MKSTALLLSLISVAAFEANAAVTITSTGDTSVSGTEFTHTARGLSTSVQISNNSGANRHKGYFLFDVSAYTSTPGFDASTATFTLHFLGGGNGVGTGNNFILYGLNSGFSGTTSWNESTVISTSAPGNADFNGFTTGSTQLATLEGKGYDFDEAVDFTIANIGDYVQSDGTVTLMFVGATTGDRNHYVGSRNNEDTDLRPTLTVIPEPSTALLSVIGVFALFRRRR